MFVPTYQSMWSVLGVLQFHIVCITIFSTLSISLHVHVEEVDCYLGAFWGDIGYFADLVTVNIESLPVSRIRVNL